MVSLSASHQGEARATELAVPVSDELWEEDLASIQSCSINSRYRLIQFKVLHSLYYSKTGCSKLFEPVSPMCDRCEGPPSHLLCHCPVLGHFWWDKFNCFQNSMKSNIQPDCIVAIFGCSDRRRAWLLVCLWWPVWWPIVHKWKVTCRQEQCFIFNTFSVFSQMTQNCWKASIKTRLWVTI